MTNSQKQLIVETIQAKKAQLGSYAAVATVCTVSEPTINQIVNGKYVTKGDSMWLQLAASLKVNLNRAAETNGWQIAHTQDVKKVLRVIQDAKMKSLFIPISDSAGIGKSAGIKLFTSQNNQDVFWVVCRSWGQKAFLQAICKTLGISIAKGWITPNDLLDKIIEFFQQRVLNKPVLIIDQANSLKPKALNSFIDIFNELEDQLGVVICGTENLEKSIKRGVQYDIVGYDEIDSRFGRNYIKLNGATLKDITAICEANGITEKETISKIFEELKPMRKEININGGGKSFIRTVRDMRRIKRIVQRELLLTEERA